MMSNAIKIAVYFGSFDPIHKNHLALCEDLESVQKFNIHNFNHK